MSARARSESQTTCARKTRPHGSPAEVALLEVATGEAAAFSATHAVRYAGAGATPRGPGSIQLRRRPLVLRSFGDGGRELCCRPDLQHHVHGELGVLRLHLGLELAGGLRCG